MPPAPYRIAVTEEAGYGLHTAFKDLVDLSSRDCFGTEPQFNRSGINEDSYYRDYEGNPTDSHLFQGVINEFQGNTLLLNCFDILEQQQAPEEEYTRLAGIFKRGHPWNAPEKNVENKFYRWGYSRDTAFDFVFSNLRDKAARASLYDALKKHYIALMHNYPNDALARWLILETKDTESYYNREILSVRFPNILIDPDGMSALHTFQETGIFPKGVYPETGPNARAMHLLEHSFVGRVSTELTRRKGESVFTLPEPDPTTQKAIDGFLADYAALKTKNDEPNLLDILSAKTPADLLAVYKQPLAPIEKPKRLPTYQPTAQKFTAQEAQRLALNTPTPQLDFATVQHAAKVVEIVGTKVVPAITREEPERPEPLAPPAPYSIAGNK